MPSYSVDLFCYSLADTAALTRLKNDVSVCSYFHRSAEPKILDAVIPIPPCDRQTDGQRHGLLLRPAIHSYAMPRVKKTCNISFINI